MWKKGVRFRLQKLGLNLLAACCLLPVIFLLANSLCVGGTVSLTQYEDILLYQRPFYVWFWNSAAYTASTLAVSLPVSVLAGYGFSQFSFPGRNFLLGFYVLLMLMPFQATVVSQYLTLNALGLLDTPWAVIWPNAFQTFGVFMMTQFMASIDRELLQAARLDGAGHGTLFFRIVLPSSVPYIFAGLQIAVTAGWSAVVGAEMVRSDEGVGWMIVRGMNTGNTVQIMVGMVAIGIIGFILANLTTALERRLCAWNEQKGL